MDDIAYLIGQESAALDVLVAALLDEQALLKCGQADDLAPAVERKNRQLESLSRFSRRRNELLAARRLQSDREGVTAWGAATGQGDLVTQFLAKADTARELNRVNGQLIALRLQATQSALASLVPAKAAQGLYGPTGKTSFSTGYRLIDSA